MPSSDHSSTPNITSSSKKQRNSQPAATDGKNIVALPPSDGVITDRDFLTRLPAKEGNDLYVGDIIWSKVAGYPWWPCMITLDPQTGKYSRPGGNAEKSGHLYHVQYFGSKALRSYTSPGLTMPFEGREKYELELDRIKNTPGTQKALRKQALSRLAIKPSFKKEWRFACDKAEEALKLDRETRIKQLTFEYVVVKSEKTPSKKEEVKTPKSKKSKKPENPLNVYDFSDGDEDFEEEGTSPTLCLWSQKRANRKGDFSVYAAQTRPKLVEEKPDLSEEELDKMLEARWNNMSDDLKAKYFVREVNGTDKTPAKKTPVKKEDKSPRGRKRKSETKVKTENQSNGDASTTEGNGNISEDESALVIADTTTPKKSRKSQESDGTDKRSSKALKVTISAKSLKVTISTNTPKDSKTPKTPKSTKSKETSPRKRPSSTLEEKSDTSATPKRPRKSTSKENGHVAENEKNENQEGDKRKDKEKSKEKQKSGENEKSKDKTPNKRKSVVQQIDTVESEETRISEDASSLSEVESNENKEENDRVCEQCSEEAIEDFIQCSGPCLRIYHKNHVPKTFNHESIQCLECASNTHLCFICRSHSPDVKKCSDDKCGKFYHVKCLQESYPHKMIKDENNEGFTCPLHFCLTCYVEHQDDQCHGFMKKRLLRCLKCPTAYHLTDACLAAGSISLSFSYIICPEHIPSRASKHVTVNWCFSCNQGGSLICCERCPAAFHQACLETPLPEGSFFCGDCLVRKQLHYNDIVWVKFCGYRWWPGRVCHPKNVPDNVMNLPHSRGEFPVYFFGSHDYYWINRGKAFHFVEGDLNKAPALSKSSKSKDFKDAITEAIEAFTSWQEARRNADNSRKIKPPPYVYLRCNKRVGKAPKNSPKEDDDTEPIVCSCKSDAESPCGIDEDCFNRLTLIECDPSRCNAGDKCQNRRFRKREYAKVSPFKTESRGWGLRAVQDIKKGSFVIEYVGELIDEAECEARIKTMIENNESNFYFLTIDRETIIDAGPKGNLARFMNHSCSPNCETQKWLVGGVTRVGLFAIQDIPKGTELTFNYNLCCRGNEKTVCNCGAKNCSGFLGVRPSKLPEEESSKKAAKPEKPKPKPNNTKKEFESRHEDECYKCGEGGELIMCDRRKCPKSYHLSCLKLTKLPRGLWFCPWHHCDECGKNAAKFCDLCPTSFCNDHGTNLLNKNDKGKQICYEHLDDIEKDVIPSKRSKSSRETKSNGEANHKEEKAEEVKTQAQLNIKEEPKTNEQISKPEKIIEAQNPENQEEVDSQEAEHTKKEESLHGQTEEQELEKPIETEETMNTEESPVAKTEETIIRTDEEVQSDENVEKIEEDQPVKEAQPVVEVQTVDEVLPTQDDQSVESVESAGEVEPVDRVNAVEEVKPIEEVKPVEETQPAEKVQPVEENQPVEEDQAVEENSVKEEIPVTEVNSIKEEKSVLDQPNGEENGLIKHEEEQQK